MDKGLAGGFAVDGRASRDTLGYPGAEYRRMLLRRCTARTFGGSEVEDITGILAIIFVLGVPSMALATHLVLRPLIREYGKLRGLKEDKDEIEARMAQLEDIVHDLDRQVNRLLEAEQFRRELESGKRRGLPGP